MDSDRFTEMDSDSDSGSYASGFDVPKDEHDGDSDSETELKKLDDGQESGYSKMSSEKKESIKERDSRSVYVGNVHYDVNEDHLQKVFQACGVMKSITIPVNKVDHPKGFAYIEFETPRGQKHALEIDGLLIRGRRLKKNAALDDVENGASRREDDDLNGYIAVSNDISVSEQTVVMPAKQTLVTPAKQPVTQAADDSNSRGIHHEDYSYRVDPIQPIPDSLENRWSRDVSRTTTQYAVDPKRTNIPGMSYTDKAPALTVLMPLTKDPALTALKPLTKDPALTAMMPLTTDQYSNRMGYRQQGPTARTEAPVAPPRMGDRQPGPPVRTEAPVAPPGYGDIIKSIYAERQVPPPPRQQQQHRVSQQQHRRVPQQQCQVPQQQQQQQHRRVPQQQGQVPQQQQQQQHRRVPQQQGQVPQQQQQPLPPARRTKSASGKRSHHQKKGGIGEQLNQLNLADHSSRTHSATAQERARPDRRRHQSDVSVSVNVTHASEAVGQTRASRPRIGAIFNHPF